MKEKKMLIDRAAIAVGAAMMVIGIASLAVALCLTGAARSGTVRAAELERALARDDAKNYISNAAALLEAAAAGDKTDINGAARALDQLACACSALLRADVDGGREIEAVRALRERTVVLISDGGAAAELARLARRLAEAIEKSNREAAGSLADEIRAMGGDNAAGEFDRGFASLDHAAALTEGALRERAASFFSKNAVLGAAEGVAFPPSLTLCGENLMVTVSRARGQLLELYFDRPAGDERLTAAECSEAAAAYAVRAGIDKGAVGSLRCLRSDELCGGWIFTDKGERVLLGVRWDSGRVFYFNAYGYYR